MSENIYKYLREEVFPTPFCPGCGHGILLGSITRAIDSLNLDMTKVVFVSGIGCAAWIPSPHLKADTLHTLHGRAVAFASGLKFTRPDLEVIVISGDGDLAAIGGNHLIHAARRNVPITVICANNSIYGMTGGQQSPTTPCGAFSETTPEGNPEKPFDLCRLMKACDAQYVARYTVWHARQLIKAIEKAIATEGFSFLDVVSPCPTQFGRKNKISSGYDMLMDLKARSVLYQKAKTLPREELEGKVVIGEFND